MSSTPRFDITRVRLRHYRSIAGCDVCLGPMSILVGPNGAGKSNFVDSLRLVAQALSENLDNALRERGGATEVRRRSNGQPNHFGIDLDLACDGHAGSYGFRAGFEGGDHQVTHEDCRVTGLTMGSEDHHFSVRAGQVVSSSEGVLPAVAADRLLLVAASGVEAFRPVFDGLGAINVFSLNPDVMRQVQKPDAGDLLRRDGSNVASVLQRLSRQAPDVKARIEDYLRGIVPGIVSVNRKGYSAYESLEFRQVVEGSGRPWSFPATSMSDGTLLALGVLVALFDTGREINSPIGIEEPEAALHPAATGLLPEALRAASESRQVLATSHSPDLLDSSSVAPDEILAVRAESGTTVVGRPDRAASRALRDSTFTAGELLRSDQLQPEQPVRSADPVLFG